MRYQPFLNVIIVPDMNSLVKPNALAGFSLPFSAELREIYEAAWSQA
jgi:hypothetical protein